MFTELNGSGEKSGRYPLLTWSYQCSGWDVTSSISIGVRLNMEVVWEVHIPVKRCLPTQGNCQWLLEKRDLGLVWRGGKILKRWKWEEDYAWQREQLSKWCWWGISGEYGFSVNWFGLDFYKVQMPNYELYGLPTMAFNPSFPVFYSLVAAVLHTS